MTFYQQSIIEATGCTKADAPIVEEIMRHTIFHSTLDWQTKKVFDKGARDAYDVHLYEIGIDNPEGLRKFARIMDMSILGKENEKLLDEICDDNEKWVHWGKYVRSNKLTIKEIKC